MADPKIRIRRSATPNKVPSTTQLQLGELAINTYDGKVYLEQDQGGVGVGTTVIAINPWSVGIGSTAYNTHFLSGKAGIGTTNAQYNLDVGGNINFTGNLYQDGSLYTSGTTGIGIGTAGGVVGYAATIVHFKGPGVTTAYYSSATGIGTINFHSVTTGGGGGGGASVTVSDSAPGSPSNGDLWFKSDVGELYVWYTDGSSNQWVEASGGSNTVITSDTAPSSPNDGDLWWNSNTGELKIYYNDGNSSQWVDANSEGGFLQYWTQTNTNGTLGVTTTSYVGIGTTTATDALTVRGNANITGFLTAAQFGPITTPGINVTGVATALQLKGPLTSSGINVTGVSTFSGDVKIGGVLTYEDVRNVDSIGIVTARTGIKVLAGGANIVDGTTTDELNVTGVSTFAGNIDANADLDVDGHTELDNVNVVGIATIQQVKATTVNVTGVSTVTGGVKVGTAATICSEGNMTIDRPSAGIITATKFIGDGSDLTGVISGIGIGTAGGVVGYAATIVHFKGAGVTTAYYNASTGIGTVFFHSAGGGGGSANVTIADAPPGSPSAGDLWWESDIGELKIYYNDGNSSQWVDASGADSLVQIGTSAPTGAVSGDLWWNSESGDLMVYYTDANSSAWISVNAVNSERIWSTNSTGIHTSRSVGIGTTTVTDPLTVVGATDLDGTLIVSGITTFGSHVYHGDSDRAIFGDGSDLELYHNGSNSIIDNNTGELHIGGDHIELRNSALNSTRLASTSAGALELFYSNTKRFTTTNGGAQVFGTVGAAQTALIVEGDARITGIITVGTGSLKITDRDINMVGVITGANFKSGTTNVHNVGVEAAGINVLGADTPIGTGATVYNSGLIVSKKGAEFQGVVTASNFSGNITLPSNDITTRNLKVTGIGTFDGNLNVLGTLTYEDVKNVDAIGISTARQGLRITGGGLNVVGVSTFGGVVDIPTVAGTNTNADLSVLFQTATGVIDGGSGLAFNPGENALKVNGTGSSGLNLTGSAVRGDGGALTLTTQNNNGQCDIHLTDILVFDTGGSERLRITSGGQVNIGGNYTQTFNALDVTGNIKASGRFNANDAVFIWQQNRMSLGNSFIIESQQNTPFAILTQAVAQPIVFGTNSTERLRITSDGDLCVGKTSAIGKAEIATSASEIGLTVSNSVHDSQLQILASASNKNSSIFFGDGGDGNIGWIDYDHNDNNLNFRVNGSERLRIDSSGLVAIGHDTPSSFSSGANNLVVNDAAGAGGITIVTPNNVMGSIFFADSTSATGQGRIRYDHNGDYMTLNTNATERLRIDSGGSVTIGDAATHTLSAHSEGDDLVVGGAGWRGMTIYGEGGGGVIQFADNADNRVGQIMYSHGDNSMIFRVAGNQTRMLIDASGRVIIGDTDADNAHANADDLVIGNTSNGKRTGISIVSDTDEDGMIHFSDGTGAGQYVGQLNYHHNDNTFRFYTAGTERLAIDNNGNVYFANDTNTYIGHPTTDTLAVWSAGTERLRIDASGRVIIGGTTHAGGAQLVVMGGNINAYAAVAMGNKTTAPSDGHVFAMFRLNSGSAGTSRGAEIIAKADGAWTAGSSYPTKLEFAVTKKGDTTVSGAFQIRQYGITHIYRPQIGAVNSNTSLTPATAGYIGDDLGLGLKAVYYMGWKNSSASSNYSHNMVDTYYSGHWGQHTQVLIWSIMHYYNVGFRMWNVNAGGGITTVSEWGDGAGSLSVSSTLVGSGTHSGQDVWRRSITCTNSGTYTQHLWFCGLIGGGTNGHCGTNLSQSSADSYFSTRGGGIHFNTIGDADMKASPFYSTWH